MWGEFYSVLVLVLFFIVLRPFLSSKNREWLCCIAYFYDLTCACMHVYKKYMRLVCIPVSSFDPPLDTIGRSVILVIVTFPGHINSWVLNLPIYDRD